jgi:NAD(P)-dependent dehydrogenase (short-subunit alcohol dehydrogenase family)
MMMVCDLSPEGDGQMNVADKTVLITGSTDGVGKLVALRLAASGARALLHGRNEEKVENVLRAIRDETGIEHLEYYQADFSSLDDVRHREGQTGIYFDGKRPERANAQAYDTAARERLRTLSLRLTNLSSGE